MRKTDGVRDYRAQSISRVAKRQTLSGVQQTLPLTPQSRQAESLNRVKVKPSAQRFSSSPTSTLVRRYAEQLYFISFLLECPLQSLDTHRSTQLLKQASSPLPNLAPMLDVTHLSQHICAKKPQRSAHIRSV